jgi:poly(3-hydroxybutyrate) depolymerase
MFRRLSAVSLLCAWLCASGAMLDLAQVAAWARMFAGYARTESLASAAKATFDPGRPCEICKAVSMAREASGRHAPAVPSAGGEKMVLIFERSAPFFAPSALRTWPEAAPASAPARSAEVPVPPPRGPAPIALS